jgi:hexosaminidase
MTQEKFYSEKQLYGNKKILLQVTIICISLLFLYPKGPICDWFKSLFPAYVSRYLSTEEAVLKVVNHVADNEQNNEKKAMTSKGIAYNFQEDSISKQYKHSLLPVPQQVSFSGQTFLLNEHWTIQTNNISGNDPAVQSLIGELKDFFTIRPSAFDKKNNSLPAIQLIIKAGAVPIGQATDTHRTALGQQAYRLKLNNTKIEITANASQGLFYGVQTLLQLVKSQKAKIYLPQGEITDWPDTQLRMIYWDDAHHLEHLDALKEVINQAARFKINAFALKLEGHFQYESAKPIVEPYAFTKVQYQELTDYARGHHIELIPYLDAPAHVSFILKHPEYANLKALPNSNYELSVTNPAADTLVLRMFGELTDANKGGKYVLLSTDEAYYVGKAKDDQKQAEAIGGRGKLLAKYITRIANELHKQGRTVIFWGEYPLTPSDIPALPSHLVNGVYDSAWAPLFKAHGMRQLIYTYTQGEEPLFPSYYPMSSGDTILDASKDRATGRVEGMLKTISSAAAEQKSNCIGVIVAGWADAGLHPETFWLGYAAGAAAGWNHRLVTAGDLTGRFYNSFYGLGTVEMDKVYQLLSRQAQFYDESWEWKPSALRPPIFGNHAEIYKTPKPVRDQTLPMLPVPSANDLSVKSDWSKINEQRLQSAKQFLKENDQLVNLLHENIRSVQYQHYNIEVMLSVALLCRQNLTMLLSLEHIDSLLKLSSKTASKNASAALALIDETLAAAEAVRAHRNETLQSLVTIWYKQWFPRVEEANGRRFLNTPDDVKDHRPGRTVDMSYLIYRELNYPLGKWVEDVRSNRNSFALKKNLSERKEILKWGDMK